MGIPVDFQQCIAFRRSLSFPMSRCLRLRIQAFSGKFHFVSISYMLENNVIMCDDVLKALASILSILLSSMAILGTFVLAYASNFTCQTC